MPSPPIEFARAAADYPIFKKSNIYLIMQDIPTGFQAL